MTDQTLAAADPRLAKACCADLWAHPGVRLVAGEALRPGGLDLTRRALDRLDLRPGARVVDVGTGPGSTLRLLSERGLRPVGVEYGEALAQEAAAAAPVVVGDGERLPVRSGAAGAVLMECVLSAIPDKRAALGEAARVLVSGGTLLLSDVMRSGPLPEPLGSFAGWIACAAGALPRAGYLGLLEEAGFEVTHQEDHSPALIDLIAQARRRLALLRVATAVGIVADLPVPVALLDVADGLLEEGGRAVASGTLGYALFLARRGGAFL